MRDMVAGTLTLVSINSAGTASGDNPDYVGDSYFPVITPDGRFVAFESFDTDLVAGTGEVNGTQIFVRNT